MLKQIRIQNNFQLGQCSDSRAGSLPAVAPSTFRPLRIFPSTQIYQNIKTSLFSLYRWALSMKTHHCCHSGFPTHSGKSTAIVIVVRKKISFLFYNPSLSVQYVVGQERARHLLTIWHLKAAQLFLHTMQLATGPMIQCRGLLLTNCQQSDNGARKWQAVLSKVP